MSTDCSPTTMTGTTTFTVVSAVLLVVPEASGDDSGDEGEGEEEGGEVPVPAVSGLEEEVTPVIGVDESCELVLAACPCVCEAGIGWKRYRRQRLTPGGLRSP